MTDAAQGFADITLSRPIEINGAKVSALRMREPTVADQMAADAYGGSDAQKELAAFANLCEVSPDDLKKLPMRDYKRLQKAFVSFLD